MNFNITYDKARQILVKDDQERWKWSRNLYGIDTADASLYDIVIHIDKLGVDDAVDIIADTVNRPCFQTTDKSQAKLDNRVLCAKLEAELAGAYPTATCHVKEGTAHVSIKDIPSKKDKIDAHIRELLKDHKEVKDMEIHIIPPNLQ